MKRLLAFPILAAALLAPQAASARVVELGSKVPKGAASCPENCQALTRVTAYQGRGGDSAMPFRVPHKGKLVALTVRLGTPNAEQQKFFRDNYGAKPQVALSVLRRPTTKGKTKYDHTLIAQSPTYDVSTFFGSAPTFTFDKPLDVSAGNIVALTVPTWAPVFSVGLPRNHWWRSSRPKSTKSCKDVAQNAQMTSLMSTKTFGCTYFNTRLYYTATYVPYNKATSKATDTTDTDTGNGGDDNDARNSSAGSAGAKGA